MDRAFLQKQSLQRLYPSFHAVSVVSFSLSSVDSPGTRALLLPGDIFTLTAGLEGNKCILQMYRQAVDWWKMLIEGRMLCAFLTVYWQYKNEKMTSFPLYVKYGPARQDHRDYLQMQWKKGCRGLVRQSNQRDRVMWSKRRRGRCNCHCSFLNDSYIQKFKHWCQLGRCYVICHNCTLKFLKMTALVLRQCELVYLKQWI